jgi:hypothetical protein
MNTLNYSPLKSKYPQHELMTKLSFDINLHNRLKLAEIGKYSRYIKNNNLIESVYKFSGKKHLIDKDILYSDLLKQKYKDCLDNKVDESVLTDKSLISPKFTLDTSPFTQTTFSKKETAISFNPFKIVNQTNINYWDRNRFRGASLRTLEVKKTSSKINDKVNISNDSIPCFSKLSSKKNKPKNLTSSGLFKQSVKLKSSKTDVLGFQNELKIPRLDTNSTIYNMKMDLEKKNSMKKCFSGNNRENSCPKVIVRKKTDCKLSLYEINNRQIKVICNNEFSRLNKISDSIQTTLKDAKFELMKTEFFKKKTKDIKFNFNLLNRNVYKTN